MNLKQFHTICAVADSNLNISVAARKMHISQPALSAQILALEHELGLEIFARDKKRLTHVTAAGEKIIEHARAALNEAQSIKEFARAELGDETGNLIIAASHTQSKRVLPTAIRRFITKYPKVEIVTRHCDRKELTASLLAGKADLGLTTDFEVASGELMTMPSHTVARVALVHSRHPLLRLREVKLEDLANYPLLIPGAAYFDSVVHRTFQEHGLSPKIAVRATNADTIKEYVGQRLGISILTEFTYDARRDRGIKAINVNHLFGPSRSVIVLNRKKFLHEYTYKFIELLAPHLTRRVLDQSLAQNWTRK